MTKDFLKRILKSGGIDIRRHDKTLDRYRSLYEKYKEYTMVPSEHFMQNLGLCQAYAEVAGDFVECGVWRGGMSAAIVELLGKDRHVDLYDSFEGLPPAKEIDGKEALAWQKDITSPNYHDNCTADEHFAMAAMKLANHADYTIHRGWFDATLPVRSDRPISILRLDGDWYDSIYTCLRCLFPKVVAGGIIILDDYYTWDGCSKAVHDYLSEIKSPSRIHQWSNSVGFIIKKS
jgi:O-methyltransferase